MPLKFIAAGYGGKCSIDDKPTLLTSYSLSLGTNVIKSSASVKMYDRKTGWSRIGGPVLRDCPSYELSISIMATNPVLDAILEKIYRRVSKGNDAKSMSSQFKVEFTDEANGLEYKFDKCYMSSFSLSIERDAAANVTMSFSYFNDSFELSWSDSEPLKYINSGYGERIAGMTIIPYWVFGVEYNGIEIKSEDLENMTITYTQAVNPKFGCYGDASLGNAPKPTHVIFGAPSATYDMTFVTTKELHYDPYTDKDSNKILLDDRAHQVKVKWVGVNSDRYEFAPKTHSFSNGNERSITLNKCYPDSFVPQVATASENTIAIQGTVYGSIEFAK